MAYLDLTHLVKTFGTNRVVKDFSLGIAKGEFVSLLGPSGCGIQSSSQRNRSFNRRP